MAYVIRKDAGFRMSKVAENTPLTAAIFENSLELESHLRDQFYYPTMNSNAMPYYCFSEEESKRIAHAAESVYGALVDSLDLLFNKYEHKIFEFFGADFLGQHQDFIDYARHVYNENHEAIYGRFDIAFDFNSGEVLGVYEFNGDTPVMLFESVVMQNIFAEQIGKGQDQCNYWPENLAASINRIIKPFGEKRIAFLGDMEAIEDALTAEYLRWAFDSYGECYLHDISELEYDFLLRDKPFHVKRQQFDYIYMLMPWEEMVENSPDIIADWRKWADSVRFFEPAWRWFVSNKGSMAWLWWLMNSGLESEFVEQHRDAMAYLLPTFMREPVDMPRYVRKPLMGRLSRNIAIMSNGEVEYETDGDYWDCPMIYQEYCETGALHERGKAIVGVWMAPYGREALVMEASTLCVREYDDAVTDIGNERFIPHIVEG